MEAEEAEEARASAEVAVEALVLAVVGAVERAASEDLSLTPHSVFHPLAFDLHSY